MSRHFPTIVVWARWPLVVVEVVVEKGTVRRRVVGRSVEDVAEREVESVDSVNANVTDDDPGAPLGS